MKLKKLHQGSVNSSVTPLMRLHIFLYFSDLHKNYNNKKGRNLYDDIKAFTLGLKLLYE